MGQCGDRSANLRFNINNEKNKTLFFADLFNSRKSF